MYCMSSAGNRSQIRLFSQVNEYTWSYSFLPHCHLKMLESEKGCGISVRVSAESGKFLHDDVVEKSVVLLVCSTGFPYLSIFIKALVKNSHCLLRLSLTKFSLCQSSFPCHHLIFQPCHRQQHLHHDA